MIDRKMLYVLVIGTSLAACGGGDSGNDDDNGDDGNNGGNPPATETGVFIDSAVAGIGYRTETQEGETNGSGEFEYVEGETVTFFLGDLELPAVAGGSVITLLDLFDTEDFDDQRVINVARLLQSLDEDGNPDNGITLSDAAHAAAAGLELDFDVPVDTFAANADVINLVSNGGGAGTLVSADAARAHLEQLSVVGSWVINNEDELIVVTMLADDTFVFIEGSEPGPEDDGQPGIEYGSYTWDPVTKAVTATAEVDTTGEWGVDDIDEGDTMTRVGNQLVISDGTVFDRVANDGIIGAWAMKIPEEEKVIVITFTETHYAHGEVAPSDDVGQSGPEFGEYTWDTATGDFLPVALIDLNGEWGFSSDAVGGIKAAVDGDTLTFTYDDGESVSIQRVK